MVLEQTTIT